MVWESMGDNAAYPLSPPPFWATAGKTWIPLKRHGAATVDPIFFKFGMLGMNRPRYAEIQ